MTIETLALDPEWHPVELHSRAYTLELWHDFIIHMEPSTKKNRSMERVSTDTVVHVAKRYKYNWNNTVYTCIRVCVQSCKYMMKRTCVLSAYNNRCTQENKTIKKEKRYANVPYQSVFQYKKKSRDRIKKKKEKELDQGPPPTLTSRCPFQGLLLMIRP